MSREIKTNIHAILEIAMLTNDLQGATGALIRRELFALCGNQISDDEIKSHVEWIIAEQVRESGKTAEQLLAEFEAWQARLPPLRRRTAEQDIAEEDAYHLSKVKEIVTWMRMGF